MNKKSPILMKIAIITLAVIGFLFLNVIIRTYFCMAYRVQLSSMEPTLQGGNLVLVNKVVYHLQTPKRGDIVIFNLPGKSYYTNYIKRIIGLPGEVIEIKDGSVFINSVKIQEPYLNLQTEGKYGPQRLNSTECFVLGDNRSTSFDSREFGPIKLKNMVGKAFFIIYPIADANFI